MFMSNPSSAAFWKRIDDACRELGYDVPFDLDSAEGNNFLNSNPLYYFKYLNKTTIVAELCSAIDLDITIAGSAAKKFYNYGYEAMLNYLNMKLNGRTSA